MIMSTLDQIAGRIIKEQELILGPLAWDEAANVPHLQILDRANGSVDIPEGPEGSRVIDELVNRYVDLFGRAAREACREAAHALVADLPPGEVPESLR